MSPATEGCRLWHLRTGRSMPVLRASHFYPRLPHQRRTWNRCATSACHCFPSSGEKSWDVWWLTAAGAQHHRSLKSGDAQRYFESRKADFAPWAIFRAKTWARAHEARQLDFVDVGLLPLVEGEADIRLRQLFDDMLGHMMDALGMSSGTLNEVDAHGLVKANFGLLA